MYNFYSVKDLLTIMFYVYKVCFNPTFSLSVPLIIQSNWTLKCCNIHWNHLHNSPKFYLNCIALLFHNHIASLKHIPYLIAFAIIFPINDLGNLIVNHRTKGRITQFKCSLDDITLCFTPNTFSWHNFLNYVKCMEPQKRNVADGRHNGIRLIMVLTFRQPSGMRRYLNLTPDHIDASLQNFQIKR